jgi:hypothetical protein
MFSATTDKVGSRRSFKSDTPEPIAQTFPELQVLTSLQNGWTKTCRAASKPKYATLNVKWTVGDIIKARE